MVQRDRARVGVVPADRRDRAAAKVERVIKAAVGLDLGVRDFRRELEDRGALAGRGRGLMADGVRSRRTAEHRPCDVGARHTHPNEMGTIVACGTR